MRNIIVSMRVTLDGFIAGPQGEMEWMEEFFDEALATYESELQKTVDTALFGRVTLYWLLGSSVRKIDRLVLHYPPIFFFAR